MFKICTLALALLASTVQAQGNFDWNITERETDFVTVEFSDASAGDEVKLNYYASNKTTLVQILDYENCNMTVTNGASAITTASSPTVGTDELLEVPLDIIQASIAASDYYTAQGSNNETGVIQVCVRIDLMGDIDGNTTNGAEESINFHETKIQIEIDMTKGFEVTGVSTNRTAATETEKNATLDYTVLAFETDETGADLTGGTQQYTQGDFLQIGVRTNGTGVEVANIIEMTLTGDTTFESVKASDASTSALTERTCDGTVLNNLAGCKVKTMLVSDFFVNANPSAINVTGTAVMQFARARRLSSFRGLQEASDTNEEFGLSVPLQPMDMGENTDSSTQDNIDMIDSAASTSPAIIGGVLSFVVAVFSFFLL